MARIINDKKQMISSKYHLHCYTKPEEFSWRATGAKQEVYAYTFDGIQVDLGWFCSVSVLG